MFYEFSLENGGSELRAGRKLCYSGAPPATEVVLFWRSSGHPSCALLLPLNLCYSGAPPATEVVLFWKIVPAETAGQNRGGPVTLAGSAGSPG